MAARNESSEATRSVQMTRGFWTSRKVINFKKKECSSVVGRRTKSESVKHRFFL